MTFDPLRRGRSNRDRRDIAFARSVIAEATRRHNETVKVDLPKPVVKGFDKMFKTLEGVMTCCSGSDPACPTHGIAASNARQSDYWRRVGGHPDAGYQDGPDKEFCAFCNAPLDCDPEPNYPYCSTQCAIDAEQS